MPVTRFTVPMKSVARWTTFTIKPFGYVGFEVPVLTRMRGKRRTSYMAIAYENFMQAIRLVVSSAAKSVRQTGA